MAFLRQIAVTLLMLALAGCLWLYLSPAPGRYLLAEPRLPEAVRALVAALSSADDAPKVGATKTSGRDGSSRVPLVAVDAAVPGVTRDRLRAIGSGEAVRTVAVRPDATGTITQIAFKSGDAVEAGATLVVLQDDAERIAVDRARITLAAAEDQLKRYETLSTRGSAITSVQLEDVRRARDAAALDLRSAEVALEKRRIVAPISGRVGLQDLDVGALVSGTTLIATVDDRSKLRVFFDTPEAFASQLEIGYPLQAEPSTRSGETYSGTVTAVDSRLDQASRTLRTEATIDNEGDRLRPGMSFALDISFDGQRFLSVDPLAIQWERTGPFVWVIRNDASEKSPVRIIERNVDRILVASDTLRENELVVTEGVQLLREGAPIRMRAPEAVPTTQPPAQEGEPTASTTPETGRRADASALAAPAAGATR